MAEYSSRISTFTTGDTIEAAHANDEFNTILAAFASSTGHKHDNTAGGGGFVPLVADSDAKNKISSDTSNNRFGIFVEVGGSAVEQFRFQDGAIIPVTDNDIDLGTSSLEFKDAYFDGTVNLDGLVIGSATSITDVDTDLTTVSGSHDTLASAKAIKTYVDNLSFLSASASTFLTTSTSANLATLISDETGTGALVFASSPSLTTPSFSSIVNTGTLTLPTSTDTLVGRATTDTFTNKSFNANGTGNSITNIEVADFASGVVDTDLTSVSSSDDTLASAKAIKTYVDAQVGGGLDIDSLADGTSITLVNTDLLPVSDSGTEKKIFVSQLDSYVSSSSQTLTNKTISGAAGQNTITNLNASNLASGTVPSARLSLTSSDLPTVPTTKGGTGLTTIGTAGQAIVVNSGATALEFSTIQASEITTVGNYFSNWNEISSNLTTTTTSTKNLFLCGDITVSGSAVWTVSGTGTLTII